MQLYCKLFENIFCEVVTLLISINFQHKFLITEKEYQNVRVLPKKKKQNKMILLEL